MSFRYDTPCSHGFLLWFDGEGGYWHDDRHMQQCNDPNASTKRFGVEPEQPTPPPYSLGNLTYILELEADCLRERGYHNPAQKFEAVARLLREWHETLTRIKHEAGPVNFDYGQVTELARTALAKVKP